MQQAIPLPPSLQRSVSARGALAVVVAVLANVAVVLAVGAAGVAPEFRALSVPPVAFLSALGAVGATVVYALLRDRVEDHRGTFVRVAVAVLVLSFLPDVALLAVDPAATVAGVVVLMAMHVVVAAVSVALLAYGGQAVDRAGGDGELEAGTEEGSAAT